MWSREQHVILDATVNPSSNSHISHVHKDRQNDRVVKIMDLGVRHSNLSLNLGSATHFVSLN